MAGCKPEYMPLLISTLEALLAPEVNLRAALATTGMAQTIIIVNGPVTKQIGIACDQGAAGKGYQANVLSLRYQPYSLCNRWLQATSVDKSTLVHPGTTFAG